MTYINRPIRTILLASACAVGLSACAGGPATAPSTEMQQPAMEPNEALLQAADQVSTRGVTAETLKLMELNYRRAPEDPENAIRYARALREQEKYAAAAQVLQPFADKKSSLPALKTEYASVHLEAGEYATASRFARKAIDQDPTNGEAYNILGIAQDAQGNNKASETSFRKALENWQGDPVPVMNNLALSLTAQGYLDEAAETLRDAKKLDPDRREIERNLRIVNTLRESALPESAYGSDTNYLNVPKPSSKPQ